MSVAYCECLLVALGTQRDLRMRHIAICDLYNIFSHYLINGTIFENPLLNIKCLFRISLQIFV